jgi:1-deoxy-D-xylulose-5-phosphate reductoisomerase
VLLANKESLVMAGDIFMQAVHDSGAVLLPIDSEHNAIFQCMPANYTPGHDAPFRLKFHTLVKQSINIGIRR